MALTLLVPGSLRVAAGALPPRPGETPVEYITAWLRARMPDYGSRAGGLADRILVVRAETGSGKSTVLPVAIFRILRGERTPALVAFRGAGVICTQPRVLTAVALANDVAAAHSPWNPDMVVGLTVGYQTGPVSNRPAHGLIYATIGTLAAQLRRSEDSTVMESHRFIIVDEAHERSLESDMTLMLLRNLYRRNAGDPRLPFLLLASATFEAERYAAYFGVGPANVVEVQGRQYTINTHWLATPAANYLAAAIETAVQIHEANPTDPPARADVLIFVPGAWEAGVVSQGLAAANERYAAGGPAPMLVLLINREVIVQQAAHFGLLFAPPAALPAVGGRRPARRVVVSTVVAEVGLTIDTLRYVVDCGWSRTKETYQPWGAQGIITRPAPRSRVEQRKGRAGRLFPGEFYPLYPESVHAMLDPQQLPDVVTQGIEPVFLAAVREQQRHKLLSGEPPEFRVEDMALLDPPPPEGYLAAAATATALGFLSARAPPPGPWLADPLGAAEPPGAEAPGGYGLTPLGHAAALFARISMEQARILFAGYAWGVAASDLLTAVAMFGTSPTDLLTNKERRRKEGLPPGATPLRAALPAFLAARIVGGDPAAAAASAKAKAKATAKAKAVPPLTEATAFYYRARLYLADDFAEAVLLYDAFADRLAGSDIGAVAGWCDEVGLSLGGLIEVTKKRDEIAEDLAAAGLSPFRDSERRLATMSAEEFPGGLTRFKRCLYDGLRCTLMRYDPQAQAYVTKQGLRVRLPALLTDATAQRLRALGAQGAGDSAPRPRWAITDKVWLEPVGRGDAPLLYAATAKLVSFLDGYVDPDPEFDEVRAFPQAAAISAST